MSASGAGTTYTYDPNGNLTSDGTKTYTWDAETRLTAVLQGATTLATFAYDGLGRQVEKVAAGITHSYISDGMHVAEERLSGRATGTIRYFHGRGIDDWIGRRNVDGSMTYFTADHLGSVVSETNSAGAVTFTRTYDAWGNLDATSAAVSGPAFTGRDWDAEIGLYNYRARYYDPTVGRFIGEDPLRLRGGVNLYAYVHDRPISLRDPKGLLAWAQWGGGASTAIGGPNGAVLFDASCMWVQDLEGNFGIMCCGGGGLGITNPVSALLGNVGIQGMGALCLGCKTICDMPGFYGGAQFGGSFGGGVAGTFGASQTDTTTTFMGGFGPALGSGFTAGGVAGSCKLLFAFPIKCCAAKR